MSCNRTIGILSIGVFGCCIMAFSNGSKNPSSVKTLTALESRAVLGSGPHWTIIQTEPIYCAGPWIGDCECEPYPMRIWCARMDNRAGGAAWPYCQQNCNAQGYCPVTVGCTTCDIADGVTIKQCVAAWPLQSCTEIASGESCGIRVEGYCGRWTGPCPPPNPYPTDCTTQCMPTTTPAQNPAQNCAPAGTTCNQ